MLKDQTLKKTRTLLFPDLVFFSKFSDGRVEGEGLWMQGQVLLTSKSVFCRAAVSRYTSNPTVSR